MWQGWFVKLALSALASVPRLVLALATDLTVLGYVEGSVGSNQVIEIYSGRLASTDLGSGPYAIPIPSIGSPLAGQTMDSNGTMAFGAIDSKAVHTFAGIAESKTSRFTANGDDAITLRKGSVEIDSIGQLGLDPGTQWGPDPTATVNIRRQSSVCAGETNPNDPFDPSIGWNRFPDNDVSDLDRLGAMSLGTIPALPLFAPKAAFIQSEVGSSTRSVPSTGSAPIQCGDFAYSIATSGITSASSDHQPFSVGGATISGAATLASHAPTIPGDLDTESDESVILTLSGSRANSGLGTDVAATTTIVSEHSTPSYRIHQIQGAGAYSPLVADPDPTDGTAVGGVPVKVVGAIVTAVTLVAAVDGSPADQNGFFMQSADADADANPLTSEGIFVFTSTAPTVAVGDVVTVVGEAQEVFSQTRIATNVPGGAINVTGTAPLPTPVEWSAASGIPSRNPARLSCPGTGPGTGANADTNFECFEGMRVSMPRATISASNQRRANDPFAEAFVTPWGPRSRREAGLPFGSTPEPGNAAASIWDGNPEVIEIDYDEAGLATNTELTAGSTFSATGVVGYSFGDYEFYPTQYTPIFTQPVPEAVIDPARGNELTVASFNTQHLCDDDTTDGCIRDTPVAGSEAFHYSDKLRKVSSYIINVLKSPDLIGVQEVDTLSTLQALANQISNDGGPVYQAYLLEGNDPGGIDVGFLVHSSRITGVTVEQYYREKNWYDPAVTCTPPATYPCARLHDRPPLLLRATFNGPNGPHPFAVLNNHTKSVGSVDGTGPAAERDRAKRFQQARDIATLVQQFQTGTGPFTGQGTENIPLILVGDYNAFEYGDGHVDVIGLISGRYDDAANECNAVLSAGQGTETCNLGTNIVNPPLFNTALAVPENERVSYTITQNFGPVQGSAQRDVPAGQVIDHILLSRSAQGFYLASDYGIANNAAAEQTNRTIPPPSGPVSPIRASDHDGLVAYLDFHCTANPVLNPDNDQVCGMLDNCPTVANDDQADQDGDGMGDVCDLDRDGDGLDDACDPDLNQTGLQNSDDICPLAINSDQASRKSVANATFAIGI